MKSSPIPTGPITRRLLAHYDASDAGTRIAGRSWYDAARRECADIATGTRYSPETVAAVVAVLSPRLSWAANMSAARDLVNWAVRPAGEVPRTAALGANVSKALRILNGEDAARVVSGPKVTAFWRNLCGDPSVVTLDTWASWAGLGGERGARGGVENYAPNRAEQRALDAAYRSAARKRGESPAAFQAIVWCHVRGTHE